MKLKRTFERFVINEPADITAICHGRTSGIYILEFTDGTQYVGQTLNFAKRMWQHRHGSKHHAPWNDITAINLLNSPLEKLDEIERETIGELISAGISLRNKQYNFYNTMDSSFEQTIERINHEHWASTPPTTLGLGTVKHAATRPAGATPKLYVQTGEYRQPDTTQSSSLAQKVVAAVAEIVSLIPEATSLEKEYWTISDFPSTAGGRFITLNVGRLELLYIPRQKFSFEEASGTYEDYGVHLNFPAETFLDPDVDDRFIWQTELSDTCSGFVLRNHYNLVSVDCLITPLSKFNEVFPHPELDDICQFFILQLMKNSPSSIFARWHSSELTRRIYEQILRHESRGFQ
ncbi:GIY-YIG nuclease family protein [Arcanobacterium haemolyticum]|nr:GIY-YIG nuclease family protein [Arcanobacterium haemolyticum]